MSIICPYCLSELHERAAACPHCGGVFAGRNPAGSLPVGTVLGGRYTVGEIERIDGEGILYRGAENVGRFRVTIKEYMPLTLAAERGMDATLRPKLGSEVLFKTTRMDFADLYRSIQRITPANGLEACRWAAGWISIPARCRRSRSAPCCSRCSTAWPPCTKSALCTGASARRTSGCWKTAAPG